MEESHDRRTENKDNCFEYSGGSTFETEKGYQQQTPFGFDKSERGLHYIVVQTSQISQLESLYHGCVNSPII